jgi:hypothetical protein
MISRGERPLYRLRADDGRWAVDAMSWLPVTAGGHAEALIAARAAISAWLEVPPGSFDVEH